MRLSTSRNTVSIESQSRQHIKEGNVFPHLASDGTSIVSDDHYTSYFVHAPGLFVSFSTLYGHFSLSVEA